MEPEVQIADEAVSALDVSVRCSRYWTTFVPASTWLAS